MRTVAAICVAGGLLFAQPPTRTQRLEADIESARAQIELSPKQPAPYKLAGMALDLLGRYPEARTYLNRLVDVSKFGEPKAAALRVLGISYAFTCDCKAAEAADSRAFDMLLGEERIFEAAETATELGRICLESGDLDRANKWYRKGYETGLTEPGITRNRTDLWEFRWEHAQARMAVRKGKVAEAQKHVAAARAILRIGTNAEQTDYLQYLTGYVALYSGDYATALAELSKGNPDDLFVQCLLGQTEEKLGHPEKAAEHYQRISATFTHALPAALALRYVRAKVNPDTDPPSAQFGSRDR